MTSGSRTMSRKRKNADSDSTKRSVKSKYYDESSGNSINEIVLYDSEGNVYRKINENLHGDFHENPQTRHDQSVPLWKLDIPRDVQIAKWGLGAISAASIAILIYIFGRIDSLSDKLSDYRSSLASIESRFSYIENDINDLEDELSGYMNSNKSDDPEYNK
jgi:hypothetical protein